MKSSTSGGGVSSKSAGKVRGAQGPLPRVFDEEGAPSRGRTLKYRRPHARTTGTGSHCHSSFST